MAIESSQVCSGRILPCSADICDPNIVASAHHPSGLSLASDDISSPFPAQRNKRDKREHPPLIGTIRQDSTSVRASKVNIEVVHLRHHLRTSLFKKKNAHAQQPHKTQQAAIMETAHRRIELQSPADLTYLVNNATRAARAKIDLHFPPSAAPETGDDDMRKRVEVLVDQVWRKHHHPHFPITSHPSFLPSFLYLYRRKNQTNEKPSTKST